MIQSSSRKGNCSRRAACHVLSTSCLVTGFRLYIVAMWQSRSRHWLILLYHLVLIELGECVRPCMVCSHLSTQMRCADSDSSIQRSLDEPLLVESSSVWWGRVMLPQPRIRPIWMTSHGPKELGHVCLVSVQIVVIATLSQSIRICSRDSGEVLQLAHRALSVYWGMSSQNLLILKAPCMAL